MLRETSSVNSGLWALIEIVVVSTLSSSLNSSISSFESKTTVII